MKELSLIGNPITNSMDSSTITSEVLSRFPDIKYLDHKEVNQISFPVAKRKVVLPNPRGSYYDSESNMKFVHEFLKK